MFINKVICDCCLKEITNSVYYTVDICKHTTYDFLEKKMNLPEEFEDFSVPEVDKAEDILTESGEGRIREYNDTHDYVYCEECKEFMPHENVKTEIDYNKAYDCGSIGFEYLDEAKEALVRMRRIASYYGYATIADFYGVKDICITSYRAHKLGWTLELLEKAYLFSINGKWHIEFTEPIEFN